MREAILSGWAMGLSAAVCSGRFVGPQGETVQFVNAQGQAIPVPLLEPGKPLPAGISALTDASPAPPGCRFERRWKSFLREFKPRQAM